MSDQTNKDLYFRNTLLNRHIGGNLDAKDENQNIHDQMYVLRSQDVMQPPNNRQFQQNVNLPYSFQQQQPTLQTTYGQLKPYDNSIERSSLAISLNNQSSQQGSQQSSQQQSSQQGSQQQSSLQGSLQQNRQQDLKSDVYLRRDGDRYDPYDGYLYSAGLKNDGHQLRRYKSTYIDINSAFRNTEPSLKTDDAILLGKDPLVFSNDSDIVSINQPGHSFQVNDPITLLGAVGKLSILRTYINSTTPTFVIPVGCNFMKIFYTHGIPLTYTGDSVFIELQNILGDRGTSAASSYLGSIPVNVINAQQQLKLTLTQADIGTANTDCLISSFPIGYFTPSPSYFFVVLPVKMTVEYTLNSYNFKLVYTSIAGIPLNQLNAIYPITPNNINGYHIITSVTPNGYSFVVNNKAVTDPSTTFSGGGINVYVSKVNTINPAYPNPNNYQIDIGSVIHDIVAVRLLSSEIPNTENAIRDNPIERANNIIYWNDIDDGDHLYSITIPSGNYAPDELATEIQNLFLNTPRINAGQPGFYYTPRHYMKVTININTDVVTFQSYKEFNLGAPIEDVIPAFSGQVDPTVTYQLKINNPGHGMTNPGDIILIQNAISTLGIPADVINGEHTVTQILNDSEYQISLPKFNALSTTDNTGGGSNVFIYIPDTFRLRFDQPNTMGTVLGFRNPGNPASITPFSNLISNSDPYQFEIAQNSTGQPIKITNNSLQLSGDNYIIMVAKPFTTYSTLGKVKNAFAKIILCDSPGKVLYNTFVPITYYYNDPLHEIHDLCIQFYSYDGYLFDFSGVDHSFTIEIVSVDDIPEGTGISANSGKNYNQKVS